MKQPNYKHVSVQYFHHAFLGDVEFFGDVEFWLLLRYISVAVLEILLMMNLLKKKTLHFYFVSVCLWLFAIEAHFDRISKTGIGEV